MNKHAEPDAQKLWYTGVTNQKKKRGNPAENMQQQENCKTTFFFIRQTFPSCWSTSLNLMQNVRWLLWKILKFAYCAWQSHPISPQKCISTAAVWSKWKRFQSPQSAHVILYLGHTNWETGDAKWHHYSTKCSPSFDFLCISVILFKMLFIQGGNLQSGKIKAGMKRVGHKVWVWSEVLGALHYYRRIKHHILWSGVIWGNSQVRSWRLQRMTGIKVIELWMGAQSSQEIPNRGGFMLLNNPHTKKKIWRCQNATDVTEFYLAHLVIKRVPQIWSRHF